MRTRGYIAVEGKRISTTSEFRTYGTIMRRKTRTTTRQKIVHQARSLLKENKQKTVKAWVQIVIK